MTTFSDKLADKLAERTINNLPYRGDLYLSEHRKLNPVASKFLIGFKEDFGAPAPEDVKEFILDSFDKKLTPDMTTARVFSEKGAITVVAYQNIATKSFSARKGMTSIASTVFMDQDLKETWEVKSNDSGKYLSRVIDDDIDSIVAQRRKSMLSQARHVTFASLGSNHSLIGVDSIVQVVIGGESILAEVIESNQNGIRVKSKKSDTIYDTDYNSVVEVTEMSAKDKNKFMKQVQDFYGQIYSPEYSKMMADGMKP